MSACTVSGTAWLALVASRHPHVLLGVERVSAGVHEKLRRAPICESRDREQVLDELRDHRRRRGARGSSTVTRSPALQPGRRSSRSVRAVAITKTGRSAEPLSERRDEVEQAVVGPVQVLEDEDERPNRRQRLRESGATQRTARPSGRRRPGAAATPEHRREMSSHPVGVAPVGEDGRDGARELRLRRLLVSVSRIPACGLHHLPNAQKLTSSPYGSDRPRSQVTGCATAPRRSRGARGRAATSRSPERRRASRAAAHARARARSRLARAW